MRSTPASDLWWKNAVIYCLDVETFRDGDGDGCGDLAGLDERIEHAAELGASCVWLMPLYPTPNRDDGYDISDYLGVDPRLGDLGDVVEAIRHARDRGLRVLADLVVNHTSDAHPWFRAARADRSSPFRAFYVWSDDPSAEKGTSAENWTWDEEAGQHYLHRFAPFQPDLDITNPAVREQIAKTVGFWLTVGVSGFRMDAVPFLCEEVGTSDVDTGDGRRWLHALREYAARRRGDLMLMGEVNVGIDQVESYFEDHGDALHLQLGFLINQRLWLALARGEAAPLEDLIRRLPTPPPDSGWATFLRNHDELTLDKLEPGEREEVFAAFAPDEDMRIYGHGIRRRAASMLGGDGPRLRMAWSLMLSLPGTPVVLYGDEIGMGENLALDGRMSVRTPMQWTADPSGGFSDAPPSELVRPLPDGDAGPDRVNVADQRRRPDSLLRFMARLIHERRDTPELGLGTSTLLENEPPALFAHRSDWQGSSVFAVHNLSDEPVSAELDLGADVTGVEDLLELRDHVVRDGRLTVELGPYGYLWLRAVKRSAGPASR
jgi:maltose alpha-D-glucosyltransferase/alpha-amylase